MYHVTLYRHGHAKHPLPTDLSCQAPVKSDPPTRAKCSARVRSVQGCPNASDKSNNRGTRSMVALLLFTRCWAHTYTCNCFRLLEPTLEATPLAAGLPDKLSKLLGIPHSSQGVATPGGGHASSTRPLRSLGPPLSAVGRRSTLGEFRAWVALPPAQINATIRDDPIWAATATYSTTSTERALAHNATTSSSAPRPQPEVAPSLAQACTTKWRCLACPGSSNSTSPLLA